MFSSVFIICAVCLCGVLSQDDSESSPSSPLAQLLATAAASGAVPILPLAPHNFRPKRKPQNVFSGENRPRFKPRKKVQEEIVDSFEPAPATESFPSSRRGPGAGGFKRRPRPVIIQEEEPQSTLPFQPATELPKFQLEDFFGTPEPVFQEVEVGAKVFLPPPASNSIVDRNSILEEVKARTIAITGAQAVGITKELTNDVSHRSKGARNLNPPKFDERRVGRKPRPESRPDPEIDISRPDPEQRILDGEVALGRPGTKRTKQHSIGTVERYKFENEDGSITWGYENDDGSFKEESIGVDCITKGKYGYIDPTGEVREYSYSSGVRCDPLTRQIASDESSFTGANGHGFFDYAQNKFVMPNGRRVTVVVNQGNKARGRRY